jgi:O-antigen ligase
MKNIFKWGIPILLFWGIFHAGSRAVYLIILLLVFLFVIKNYKKSSKKIFASIVKHRVKILIITLIAFLSLFVLFKISYNQIINRGGTIDHFLRPVKTVELILENPIRGSIGKIGPAARIQNLAKNNDDKALIAENIWLDYWAQLGFFGFLLALGVFLAGFFRNDKTRILIGSFFLLGNMATIFDMTPLVILFFLWLAVLED